MNWKYILVIIVLAVIAGGGILGYQYWWLPKEEAKLPETKLPEVKAPKEIPPEEISEDKTDDWKTYRSEKYGLEFRYPTTWKVHEYTHIPFVQLQQVKNGEVVAIAGGISMVRKPISSSIDSSYEEMFASNSRCPEVAGSRNLSSPSQYEEYVYCLTGKEIQMTTGVWKGAVECSASAWYGMKVEPETCPHEFWIDTKDFFYVVHFNFFELIKEGSDEEIFFDKFLKGFLFFTPTN